MEDTHLPLRLLQWLEYCSWPPQIAYLLFAHHPIVQGCWPFSRLIVLVNCLKEFLYVATTATSQRVGVAIFKCSITKKRCSFCLSKFLTRGSSPRRKFMERLMLGREHDGDSLEVSLTPCCLPRFLGPISCVVKSKGEGVTSGPWIEFPGPSKCQGARL